MVLPASGQISFNDLRVELGIPTQAPFSITTAATNGYVTINTAGSANSPDTSAPHAISEWYNYNHTCIAHTGFEVSNIFSVNECFTGTHTTTVYSYCTSPFATNSGCIVYQVAGCLSPYVSMFIQEGDGTNYELDGNGQVIASFNPGC